MKIFSLVNVSDQDLRIKGALETALIEPIFFDTFAVRRFVKAFSLTISHIVKVSKDSEQNQP